ncbi:MAG: hypothetical protein M3546_13750 [Actinomycetota bacterium]|nr:hypothetical protein [Actinomycetota bacterium]
MLSVAKLTLGQRRLLQQKVIPSNKSTLMNYASAGPRNSQPPSGSSNASTGGTAAAEQLDTQIARDRLALERADEKREQLREHGERPIPVSRTRSRAGRAHTPAATGAATVTSVTQRELPWLGLEL